MALAPPARRPLWRGLASSAAVAAAVAGLLRGCVVEVIGVPNGSMAPTLLAGDQVLVSKLAYRVRLPFSELTALVLASPRRGDVVVFRDPRDPARRLVKRVIGLPGDVVELREQTLHINGVPQARVELGEQIYVEPGEGGEPQRRDACRRWREILDVPAVPAGGDPGARPEPWAHELLQCRRRRAGRREGPYQPVPPEYLFVLGDNRDRSGDSRGGWVVQESAVVGRVAAVGWTAGAAAGWPVSGVEHRLDRLFKPVE